MMLESLLLITFFVLGLYFLGYLMGHERKKAKDKEEPFAAGVLLPIIRQKYESSVFLFAILFLVFDILAFMIFVSEGILYPVMYLIIVLLGMLLVGSSVV